MRKQRSHRTRRQIILKRLGWTALSFCGLALLFLTLVSNRFVYLSHQRFPVLANFQRNHASHSQLQRDQVLVVGHRGSGLRSTNPSATNDQSLIGNTRNAIEAGIGAGADWIEIDVRASKDGRLILFHDEKLDTKTTLEGAVDRQTWHDLQSAKLTVSPEEKILTLREAFEEFPQVRGWVLDIKVSGISTKLIHLLEELAIPNGQVVIIGSHEILQEFKGEGYRLGYTTLYSKHKQMFLSKAGVIQVCLDNSYDFLVVPELFITPEFVTNAQKRNIAVWCYGSDDYRDLRYFVGCGVSGLIVDDPKHVLSRFEK